MIEIEKRWIKFSNRIGSEDMKSGFTDLKLAYEKPYRDYHNLGHIQDCLKQMDLIPNFYSPELEFAVWFHDIVYDARNIENEEKSVTQMEEFLSNYGLQEYIPQVRDLILATISHKGKSDLISDYMIDLDLSILGRSWEVFEEYERKIRNEYVWVPLEKYYIARGGIMQGFLERPSLFQSKFFSKLYEKQARSNIKRLLGIYSLPDLE